MASLSLQHINKTYPNGFEAVKDFNLEIADKEFIIFVGPSGCGKSTTLQVSVDSLLADSVVQSKAVFEEDIQTILSDCDDYEIRVIADIAAATKKTLRKEAKLKKSWKKPG